MVSAAWANAMVQDGIVIEAMAPDCKQCVLLDPWPEATVAPTVACGPSGQPREAKRGTGSKVTWAMAPGERCTVSRGTHQ